MIDLPSCDTSEPDPERLLDQLAAEILGSDEDLVAYRSGRRWLRRFEPLLVGAAQGDSLGLLRPDGVYLITGGLGGVGLELASAIAERIQARLVLVGRTALPPAAGGRCTSQARARVRSSIRIPSRCCGTCAI